MFPYFALYTRIVTCTSLMPNQQNQAFPYADHHLDFPDVHILPRVLPRTCFLLGRASFSDIKGQP